MEQTAVEILIRLRCTSCHQYQTLSSIESEHCGGCERSISNERKIRRAVRILMSVAKDFRISFDL